MEKMHHVNKYFNQTMVIEALKMSFYKLNLKQLIKNPIMFVVEVGMILTLILICFPDIFGTSYLSRGYLITIFIVSLIHILRCRRSTKCIIRCVTCHLKHNNTMTNVIVA
ncbi:hypothetical protein GF590_07275, partial [Staphylococcus aureus]|nr:hypothetical protein [Staphylococcus aureus]